MAGEARVSIIALALYMFWPVTSTKVKQHNIKQDQKELRTSIFAILQYDVKGIFYLQRFLVYEMLRYAHPIRELILNLRIYFQQY